MKKLLYPFYRVSLLILEKIPFQKMGEKKRKTEEKLNALYYGDGRMTVETYYAKNLAVVLAILFWGGGFVLVFQTVSGNGEISSSLQYLERPVYGKGKRITELEARIEGETENPVFSVQVSEQKYTVEEIQVIFKEIMESLDEVILAENQTLDEVRSNLYLPTSMQDGTVRLEWLTSPSDLLDSSGNILRETNEDGELAEIRALLKYEEQEAEYTCFVHIYPPIRTIQEQQRVSLEKQLANADQSSPYEGQLKLPETLDGRTVEWFVPGVNVTAVLGWLVVISAFLIFWKNEKNLETLAKERKKQMILDYPDLLFKLSMLLGAGLTIHSAFVKIGIGYQKRKGKIRYAYEEILMTCQEIKNGVGETTAYMNFGKRCQEARYVKLGSILAQNLKKGNKDLRDILEREAITSMDERRNIAKKLGEEAGTKLLMPMVLMLVVVLVILLIPAVMAF